MTLTLPEQAGKKAVVSTGVKSLCWYESCMRLFQMPHSFNDLSLITSLEVRQARFSSPKGKSQTFSLAL